MDWFSWLSKTSLDPSVIYNYAIKFTQNQLEEEDMDYFNHEILQSMGISIAKHRLEILKLAKKNKHQITSMLWLVIAIKKTKNCISKNVHTWVHREDSSLAIVPKLNNYSSRWKKLAMLKKNNRAMISSESPAVVRPSPKILMLTNGGPLVECISWENGFSCPMVQDFGENEKMDGYGGEHWANGNEDIKWDAMFQDLKPT